MDETLSGGGEIHTAAQAGPAGLILIPERTVGIPLLQIVIPQPSPVDDTASADALQRTAAAFLRHRRVQNGAEGFKTVQVIQVMDFVDPDRAPFRIKKVGGGTDVTVRKNPEGASRHGITGRTGDGEEGRKQRIRKGFDLIVLHYMDQHFFQTAVAEHIIKVIGGAVNVDPEAGIVDPCQAHERVHVGNGAVVLMERIHDRSVFPIFPAQFEGALRHAKSARIVSGQILFPGCSVIKADIHVVNTFGKYLQMMRILNRICECAVGGDPDGYVRCRFAYGLAEIEHLRDKSRLSGSEVD